MAARDLLVLDPTGARARLLLAARAAPVAVAAFVGLVLGYLVVLPVAPTLAPLADAATMVFGLALLALAAGTSELTYEPAPWPTNVLGTFGAIAGLAIAALALAAIGGAGDAVTPVMGWAFAAGGAWLLASNALALAHRAVPPWVGLAGVLAGVGFLAGPLAEDPPGLVAAVAGLLTLGGLPVWAIGARRTVLGAVEEPAARASSSGVNA